MKLGGKIALVSGAGSGIGRGCAFVLAREGATVVATDLDATTLGSAIEEAAAAGLTLTNGGVADLTDEKAVEALVARATAQHGQLDILVNAAATAVFAWIEDMSYADWRKTLIAELDTVFLMTRAAWPHLKMRGGGAIINIASANSHEALEGSPALAHCAGKGGVLAMTRQLAMEGAPHGIRANTVSPGMIVTSATRPVLAQPGFTERVMAKNMIKRLGTPEDIGYCVAFLASDEAAYVTGADYRVDAGATCW